MRISLRRSGYMLGMGTPVWQLLLKLDRIHERQLARRSPWLEAIACTEQPVEGYASAMLRPPEGDSHVDKLNVEPSLEPPLD